jgi:hypothetical protein
MTRKTAMAWTRYSLLFPFPKAAIWKIVPSSIWPLICSGSCFLCRSMGGTYGTGGRAINVPFLHSEFFNLSCRDLRLELMAYCQSGVSKIRCLNADLGRTCKSLQRGSAGNFANCKIPTFCRGFPGGLAWRWRGTGFGLTRMESSANANAHVDECGLISKCPKPFAGVEEHLP